MPRPRKNDPHYCTACRSSVKLDLDGKRRAICPRCGAELGPTRPDQVQTRDVKLERNPEPGPWQR